VEEGHPPSSSSAAAHSSDLEESLIKCCAHALRHGVTSCVPEVYLDLITSKDLKMLLTAGGSLNVEVLRSASSYVAPLQETDEVVEVFWLVLSDLPRSSLLRFLQALWAFDQSTEHLPDGTVSPPPIPRPCPVLKRGSSLS
jgi:hypothetical protein